MLRVESARPAGVAEGGLLQSNKPTSESSDFHSRVHSTASNLHDFPNFLMVRPQKLTNPSAVWASKFEPGLFQAEQLQMAHQRLRAAHRYRVVPLCATTGGGQKAFSRGRPHLIVEF